MGHPGYISLARMFPCICSSQSLVSNHCGSTSHYPSNCPLLHAITEDHWLMEDHTLMEDHCSMEDHTLMQDDTLMEHYSLMENRLPTHCNDPTTKSVTTSTKLLAIRGTANSPTDVSNVMDAPWLELPHAPTSLNPWTPCCAIGYTGPHFMSLAPNLRSAFQQPEVIDATLRDECEAGQTLGPFGQPPLPNFHISGLGLVSKHDGGWRIIYHLCASFTQSINDFIDPSLYSLSYCTVYDTY